MGFSALLKQTAVVQRHTLTQNSLGEKVKSWAVVYASMPVRVQPKSYSEKQNLGADYVLAPYTIFAENEYAILDNDRIVVGSVNYEVIKAQKDSSEHHWELKCKTFDN